MPSREAYLPRLSAQLRNDLDIMSRSAYPKLDDGFTLKKERFKTDNLRHELTDLISDGEVTLTSVLILSPGGPNLQMVTRHAKTVTQQ
ncbi:hypothetical protein VTL71DRAFT_7321 [Oculimacula yallundae]|uniref:Uncharacterized protein n=1 Tax=Oculimacula yallundae TaxID=86028 RepID=A0ABR4BYZ4_9HELO